MTSDEINAAIAKWCGWKRLLTESIVLHIPKTEWIRPGDTEPHGYIPPHYDSDLNAMHGALGQLESRYWAAFVRNLAKETKTDLDVNSLTSVVVQINAPAAHRARALLKTVGLWKEQL